MLMTGKGSIFYIFNSAKDKIEKDLSQHNQGQSHIEKERIAEYVFESVIEWRDSLRMQH